MEAPAPPSTSAQTIPSLKTSFLRSQIRLLSAPLQPSSTWRSDPSSSSSTTTNSSSSSPSLPDRTINTVLATLNAHLQSHTRTAYPPQTQRHIAEQLDALYWSAVTARGLDPAHADAVVVETGADLSGLEEFEGLPPGYAELFLLPRGEGQAQAQAQAQAQDAARYAALRARLRAAGVERTRQRDRLEVYRRLGRLLEPLRRGEGEGPAHLGGEGELAGELERLRGLLAEVVGRIGGVGRDGVGGESMVGVEGGGKERETLREVMDVL